MTKINLNIPNHTKAYKDDNLIQQNAKELLLDKLENISIELKNDSHTKQTRVHNTILINGKRGYGKSTFMLSIIEIVKEKHKNDFEILDIIDPTMIESKENIFLLVLSKIQELVEDCTRASSHTDEEYKDIQKALHDIAKGLNSLDGIGEENPLTQSMWNEPEQILAEGIRNIRGGDKLGKSFAIYVSKVLKYLNKNAFVLVFDDIDTATNHGKIILELIRKYFTSPKLIVILLGDIELYSLIIRDMQWKKMNPSMTFKYEQENIKPMYSNEIDTLINQYMLKILKPENRIDLVTINAIKDDIEIQSSDELVNIMDYIKKIIEDMFYEKDKKAKPFVEYVSMQPVRTTMSILKSYHENSSKKINFLKDLEYILTNKLSNEYTYLDLHRLLEALRNQDENRYYLLYKYLKDEKDLSIDFIPNKDELDKNNLAMLVNCHIGNSINTIQDICDYFVKFYMPNQFGCDYDFNAHGFKVVRFLNKDLRKDSDSKIHKGTIHLTDKDIDNLNFKKYPRKQATLNILAVGLFRKSGLKNYISIWNLFGFVSDLFTTDSINFKKLLQIKSFSIDDNINDHNKNTRNSIQEYPYNTDNFKMLVNNSNVNLSNRQLVSIFTRVEYSIKYIDDNPEKTIGKQLHRYIIALLNAFIIVTMENDKSINFSNALSYSDANNTIYKQNYTILSNRRNDNNNELLWLYEFVELDIWKYFINTNNKKENQYNIFDDLDKIFVVNKIQITDSLKSLMVDNLLNEGTNSYKILMDFINNKTITINNLKLIIDGYKRTRQELNNKYQIITELEELQE